MRVAVLLALPCIAIVTAHPRSARAQTAEPLGTPYPPQATPESSPTPSPTSTPYSAPVGGEAGYSNEAPMPLPPRPPRHTTTPGFGEPKIVPTFAFALGIPNAWASSPGTEARFRPGATQVPIWGGVAFHPMPSDVSGWTAIGVEANLRSSLDGAHTVTEWVPEMRIGASITGTTHPEWQNIVGAPLEVYGLAGWRFAAYDRPSSVRLGIGLSSPWALAGMASVARDACVPPPTMVEAVWDIQPDYRHEFQFRFGWQF